MRPRVFRVRFTAVAPGPRGRDPGTGGVIGGEPDSPPGSTATISSGERERMNRGMMKTAGHGATLALAGLLLNVGSAQAADLGGNCCADLEERVAELEATTVRKGNRRVSLTLSGQVSRQIMYWNDGHTSDVYSVDNGLNTSRFRFTGNAKISGDVQAGFMMEMDIRIGARSNQVTQI